MFRTLIVAALCSLGMPAQHASAQQPFVIAEDVLPAPLLEALQSSVSTALGISLTRATRLSPDQTGQGVFVLGGGVAHTQATQFTAVGLIASAPMVLIATSKFPAVESADVLALLKKQPGAKIAHDGPGSTSQRCIAQLKDLLETTFNDVRDSAPASPADSVKSGDVDLACLAAPRAIPLIQAGAVTPVLVASDERLAAVWDLPTAAEVGLPQFSSTAWFGLYLAGPTPRPELIAKANSALQAVLADEKIMQSLTDAGLTPFPMTHRTPAAHAAFLAAEVERSK